MPRIARAVAANLPHHVIQRGNNRSQIFFDDQDRVKYAELLAKYSQKWGTSLWAYCLMSNHVHLLVSPKENNSLAKMMQGVTLCYTQYANKKYKRTGRLWENRYHSCIVDKDAYLWTVARYIENNPVRAKMVKKAEEYPYSSARFHIDGAGDDLIGEELFAEAQRGDYREFMLAAISKDDMNKIRYHMRTGRPLGDKAFMKRMERRVGRIFLLRKPGRPKKARIV